MTDDDEWARGMFAAINIRERINAYLGRAEEIVTREPCPGCPFRGCPTCTHQPEPIEGQGDLLEELDR